MKIGDKVQWIHGNLTRSWIISCIDDDIVTIKWRTTVALVAKKDLRVRPAKAKSLPHNNVSDLIDALFGNKK